MRNVRRAELAAILDRDIFEREDDMMVSCFFFGALLSLCLSFPFQAGLTGMVLCVKFCQSIDGLDSWPGLGWELHGKEIRQKK